MRLPDALPGQSGIWPGETAFVAAGLPDPLEATISELTALTETLPPDCDRDMRLDYLFATRIQPAFARQTLTVVHGYPASQAALARLDPNDPRISERFEVFAGPIELANGYRELTDATRTAQTVPNRQRTPKSPGPEANAAG